MGKIIMEGQISQIETQTRSVGMGYCRGQMAFAMECCAIVLQRVREGGREDQGIGIKRRKGKKGRRYMELREDTEIRKQIKGTGRKGNKGRET